MPVTRARPKSDELSESSSSNETTQRGNVSSVSSREQGLLHSSGPTVGLRFGNSVTGDLGVHTKVTVNEPDDKYEKEAECVADAVMRTPVSERAIDAENRLPSVHIQRLCPRRQRRHNEDKSLNYEEYEAELQRKENTGMVPPVTDPIQQQIQSLRGGGRPLPRSMRSFFEPRFGENFRDVRLHMGSKADEIARSVNARAFALGNNIVFANGAYEPDTKTGQRLLAHELTHVAQQASVTARRRLPAFGPSIIQRSPNGSQNKKELGPTVLEARVYRLDPSVNEWDEAFRQVHRDKYKEGVIRFFNRWETGLEKFINAMSFASSQEAEAKLGEAAAKGAAKSILDGAIGLVGAQQTGVGAVLSAAKSAAMAAYEEHKRAEKAAGERELAEYIAARLVKIQKAREKAKQKIEEQRSVLAEEFREALGNSPSPTGQGESGEQPVTLYGESAVWFKEYVSGGEKFLRSIPTVAQFQQIITEQFAATGEYIGAPQHGVDTGKGSFRPSGTLSLNVHVSRTKSDGGFEWNVTSDDAWLLGTSAPKPTRVAENLEQSLSGPVLTHARLAKNVNLTIETESSDVTTEGTLHITPPPAPEVIAETRYGDPDLVEESARKPAVMDALPSSKIAGSSQ